MMIKVQDYPNWVRNPDGTLVNTNLSEYQSYLKKKQVKQAEAERIDSLESKINNIEEQLSTIISLLKSK